MFGKTWEKRRLLAFMLLMFAFLLLILGSIYLATLHMRVRSELDQITPRYSRLLGLRAAQGQIEQALAKVRASVTEAIYPKAQTESQAGNDAQEKIRSIFSASNLQISSIQLLPAKPQGQMEQVPINVRAEGNVEALHKGLSQLAAARPVILLDKLVAQGTNQRPEAGVLGLQFSLHVLRARE